MENYIYVRIGSNDDDRGLAYAIQGRDEMSMHSLNCLLAL